MNKQMEKFKVVENAFVKIKSGTVILYLCLGS